MILVILFTSIVAINTLFGIIKCFNVHHVLSFCCKFPTCVLTHPKLVSFSSLGLVIYMQPHPLVFHPKGLLRYAGL